MRRKIGNICRSFSANGRRVIGRALPHRRTDEPFVREDLKALSHARGKFAAALHFAEMLIADCAFCERLGEYVRSRDRVLNG